eukprot:gnl/MRDRNA2_/MRDRNA2_183737_c0_seq1.p1 gnl/MRDRNA2_/MRDRNA2_183737_c0~~gnl/MRDRNA2_/MRDRNA2_183737_c0_seq1.p1  ORF type:complete len:189 (+),score=23.76 gnl/MRDRNA2_/MRDRNA2_183737_c0_seq1:85-567(+)
MIAMPSLPVSYRTTTTTPITTTTTALPAAKRATPAAKPAAKNAKKAVAASASQSMVGKWTITCVEMNGFRGHLIVESEDEATFYSNREELGYEEFLLQDFNSDNAKKTWNALVTMPGDFSKAILPRVLDLEGEFSVDKARATLRGHMMTVHSNWELVKSA